MLKCIYTHIKNIRIKLSFRLFKFDYGKKLQAFASNLGKQSIWDYKLIVNLFIILIFKLIDYGLESN